MAENKIIQFAPEISPSDTLTDEEYVNDAVRVSGNTTGIARRRPINKVLQQTSLMASGIAQYIANGTNSEADDGYNISSEDSTITVETKFRAAVLQNTKKEIEANTGIVHTTKDETISGVKKFNTLPQSEQNPFNDADLANKRYVDTADANTLQGAKNYADQQDAALRADLQNYANQQAQQALASAKDYTDQQLEDIGGGGGGGTGTYVLAPTNLDPTGGEQNVLTVATLSASEYRNAFADDARSYRHFQLGRLNANWDDLLVDVQVNEDTYTIPAEDPLPEHQGYQWRCKDVSSWGNESPWSEVGTFYTGDAAYINTPTGIAYDAMTFAPKITAGEFSAYGGIEDTHKSTDWEVYCADSSNVYQLIFSSYNDTTNLTAITPNLSAHTAELNRAGAKCKIRVRYTGNILGNSEWAELANITPAGANDGEGFSNGYKVGATVSLAEGTVNVPEDPTINMQSSFTWGNSVSSVANKSYSFIKYDISIYNNDSLVYTTSNTSQDSAIKLPRGRLQPSQTYTLQYSVQYTAVINGVSMSTTKAATAVQFQTKSTFVTVNQPTLSVEGAPSDVPEKPVLTGGAFSVSDSSYTDTHQSSQWQVLSSDGVSVIHDSGDSSSSLTSYSVPAGVLAEGTSYIFRVRYRGAIYGYSDWTQVTAATPAQWSGVIKATLTFNNLVDGKFDINSEVEASAFEYKNGAGNEFIDDAEWQLAAYDDTTYSNVLLSVHDYWNLIPWPEYNIQPSTKYRCRYRQFEYRTQKWGSWSETTFETVAEFTYPTLKFVLVNASPFDDEWKPSDTFLWWNKDKFKVLMDEVENDTLRNDGVITFASNETHTIEIINVANEPSNYPAFASGKNYAAMQSVLGVLPPLRWEDNGGFLDTAGGEGEVPSGRTTSAGGGSRYQGFESGLFGVTVNINEPKYALTTIPDCMFKYNPQILSFGGIGSSGCGGNFSLGGEGREGYGCFDHCLGLTNVPRNLFKNCHNALIMGGISGGDGGSSTTKGGREIGGTGGNGSGCFTYCENLTELPDLKYLTNVILFGGLGRRSQGAFAHTGITKIEDEAFKYCTKMRNFGSQIQTSGAISSCTKLKKIGHRIFKNCVRMTDEAAFGFKIGGQSSADRSDSQNGHFSEEIDERIPNDSGFYPDGGSAWSTSGSYPSVQGQNRVISLGDQGCGGAWGGGGFYDPSSYTGWGGDGLSIMDCIRHYKERFLDGKMPLHVQTQTAIFSALESLQELPDDIFQDGPQIASVGGAFAYNSTIPTILTNGKFPVNIFVGQNNIRCADEAFAPLFDDVPSGLEVRFTAKNITSAVEFFGTQTSKTITVYVPRGSTTAATFKALNNVNVIEE